MLANAILELGHLQDETRRLSNYLRRIGLDSVSTGFEIILQVLQGVEMCGGHEASGVS
jgi:hypothetical protein